MPLALLERFLLAWRTRIKSNRDTVSRLIAAATLLFERWVAAVFALCDNVHALERALAIGSAVGKCSDIDRAFTLHNTRIGNGGAEHDDGQTADLRLPRHVRYLLRGD